MRTGWSRLPKMIVVLFSVGCASLNTFQTAQPLGRGQLEVLLEPSVGHSPRAFRLPVVMMSSFRLGVTDRLDLGIRTPFMRPSPTMTYALLDPESHDLAISIGGQAGFGHLFLYYGETLTIPDVRYRADLNAMGSVLASVPVKDMRVVVGVRGLYWPDLIRQLGRVNFVDPRLQGPWQDGQEFGVGGSLGLSIPIGDVFRIQPEVTAIRLFSTHPLMVQGGVGIGFRPSW